MMSRKILFVCTGNICRSPLAEAVLRHQANLAGRADIITDSAGTHDYHIGERPDPRTLKIAAQNNISTDNMRARQVKTSDFEEFDLILGMDQGHVQRLLKASPREYHGKIHLFMEYCGQGQTDVPDPYYGDFNGFREVYEMCDKAITTLLKNITN